MDGNHEVTRIEIGSGEPDVYVCDNCGSHAEEPKNIQHHATCTPGESKRWEMFYSKGNEEDGLVTAFLKHSIAGLKHAQKHYNEMDDGGYDIDCYCNGNCHACDQYDYCNQSPNSL